MDIPAGEEDGWTELQERDGTASERSTPISTPSARQDCEPSDDPKWVEARNRRIDHMDAQNEGRKFGKVNPDPRTPAELLYTNRSLTSKVITDFIVSIPGSLVRSPPLINNLSEPTGPLLSYVLLSRHFIDSTG